MKAINHYASRGLVLIGSWKRTVALVAGILLLGMKSSPAMSYFDWTNDYTGSEPNTLLLWKFDNPLPQLDSSGNGYYVGSFATGTQTNAPGKFGEGVEVTPPRSTSNDSYVQGTADSSNAFNASALTIEMWFNPFSSTPGVANSTLFDKQYSDLSGAQMFFNSGTSIRAIVGNGSSLLAATTPSLSWNSGQWYHVAMTYTSGVLKIFRDGETMVSVTNLVFGNLANSGTRIYRVGQRLGSSYGSLPGLYDNFRVSSVAYNFVPEPSSTLLILAAFTVLRGLFFRREG